jgi:hypothetical protein
MLANMVFLKLLYELSSVMDFTVECDPDCAVFVGEWLMRTGMLAILSALCPRAKFLLMKKTSSSGFRCRKPLYTSFIIRSASGFSTAHMCPTVFNLSKLSREVGLRAWSL